MSLDLKEVFGKYNDEYADFHLIANPRSKRPDLHAFLLLDEILPANRVMVSAAEHDIIYLDIDVEKLAEVATEEQIQELVRCGIRFDNSLDSLSMFT